MVKKLEIIIHDETDGKIEINSDLKFKHELMGVLHAAALIVDRQFLPFEFVGKATLELPSVKGAE